MTFKHGVELNISDAEKPVPLELPNQWLWDIIDEFIYQVCALDVIGQISL